MLFSSKQMSISGFWFQHEKFTKFRHNLEKFEKKMEFPESLHNYIYRGISNVLDQLSVEQRKISNYFREVLDSVDNEMNGKVHVSAVAGSGKTRTAGAIYYMGLGEFKPESILSLSFTNIAKDTLTNRLRSQLKNWNDGLNKSLINSSTIHSYAINEINKYRISKLKKKKLEALEPANVTTALNNTYKKFTSRFSSLKTVMDLLEDQYSNSHYWNDSMVEPPEELLFFNKELSKWNNNNRTCLPFSFILIKFLFLLREKKIVPKLKLFILDEYQDLTTAMLKIIRRICKLSEFCFLFGDVNQNIYPETVEWESVSCILFLSKYKYFKLTKCFRCHPSIHQSAMIIVNKHYDYTKDVDNLWESRGRQSSKVFAVQCSNFDEQLEKCFKVIKTFNKDQTVGVFSRTSSTVSTLSTYIKRKFGKNNVYNVSNELNSVENQKKRITCSTVHKVKSTEFDHVLIVNFVHHEFPMIVGNNSSFETDTERRVAYVAFTRAKQSLFLLSPTNMESSPSAQATSFYFPSRSIFLTEIEKIVCFSLFGDSPHPRILIMKNLGRCKITLRNIDFSKSIRSIREASESEDRKKKQDNDRNTDVPTIGDPLITNQPLTK